MLNSSRRSIAIELSRPRATATLRCGVRRRETEEARQDLAGHGRRRFAAAAAVLHQHREGDARAVWRERRR